MTFIDICSSNPDLKFLLDSNFSSIIQEGFLIATDITCKNIIPNPIAARFLRIEPCEQFSPSTEAFPSLKIYEQGKLLSPEEMPMQQAAQHGWESYGRRLDFVWEDEVIKTAIWNARPLRDESHNICGSIATLKDITPIVDTKKQLEKRQSDLTKEIIERKQINTQISLQAQLLSAVHDAIVAVDEHYAITYWNTMAEKLFGWKAEEVIGLFINDVFQSDVPHSLPNEAMGEILSDNFYVGEVNYYHKDGTLIYAEVHTTVLRNVDGKFAGNVTSIRDVTKCREEQKILRSIKDELTSEVEGLLKLHSLSTHIISNVNLNAICQEILQIAIALTQADKGNIQLFVNNEAHRDFIAQFGFQESFLSYFGATSPDHGSCGQAFREKRRVIVENVVQSPLFHDKPDLLFMQEENIYCCQSTPMISSTGDLMGVLSTHYETPHIFSEREQRMLDLLAHQAADIIASLNVEEALQESEHRALILVENLRKADENKNQFLSNLSHELRNPLASIMMSLSLLKLAPPGSKQATQAIEVLERQTNQLSSLVNDLLEVTRISQNKIILKKEQVEINSLIAKTVADCQALFNDKNITLNLTLSPVPIYLQADPTRLTQIIGNLLHNSCKFTESGGQTQVTVSKDMVNNQIIFSIEDNGLGIDTEILQDMFQPFVQAEHSLAHSNGGLGLGLAIVKGMVELHGGTVTAQSEGVGRGSQFSIRLPLMTDDPIHQENRQKLKKAPYALRILVIDDIPDVAEILSALLSHLGHDVISAGSGTEGLQKAAAFVPDVIFCDIGLPDMSGHEVAKFIHARKEFKEVCLIALSGYANANDITLSIEAGFNRHLAKPVDLDTLEKVLAEIHPPHPHHPRHTPHIA